MMDETNRPVGDVPTPCFFDTTRIREALRQLNACRLPITAAEDIEAGSPVYVTPDGKLRTKGEVG